MTANIEHLKKVTLQLNIGDASPGSDRTTSPAPFTFIYGLASEGLCPFESALFDKSVGASLNFTISANEATAFFGHLLLPLQQTLGLSILPPKMGLEVEVMAVNDADNREIVQSLAKAGSGCGGGCGCGC